MSELGFCEIVSHNTEEKYFEFRLRKWNNDPDSEEINPDFKIYLNNLLKELKIIDIDDWYWDEMEHNDGFDHFIVEY